MKYLINNPALLNLMFYESYDPNFLYNKMRTILVALFNKDKFKSLLEESDPFYTEPHEKYYEGLRAEIYFSEFHQFEALFALILATFQDLPHWLYLTTYDTREIKQAAQNLIDERFDLLSKGNIKTEDDFIRVAIYSEFQPAFEEEREKWKDKRKRTGRFLRELAKRYLDATEYNAYKHGLRVMTNKTEFAITPDNQPDKVLFYTKSEDSLIFLEPEKNSKDGSVRIYQTTKHFNIKESINHVYAMQILSEQIKKTRKARLAGVNDIDLSTIAFDEERLAEEKTYFKFSVTV